MLTTILSKNWLLNLHNHLSNPKNFEKELGLITNCNIKLSDEHILNNNKTSFNKINDKILKKIKEDIGTKCNISVEKVDLSKFIHIRTALSIDKHQDIAEKEMGDFLYIGLKGLPVNGFIQLTASLCPSAIKISPVSICEISLVIYG